MTKWTVQKAYFMNLSCKTTSHCEIPKIQADSILSRKLNQKSRKTVVYTPLSIWEKQITCKFH